MSVNRYVIDKKTGKTKRITAEDFDTSTMAKLEPTVPELHHPTNGHVSDAEMARRSIQQMKASLERVADRPDTVAKRPDDPIECLTAASRLAEVAIDLQNPNDAFVVAALAKSFLDRAVAHIAERSDLHDADSEISDANHHG